MTPSLPDFTAPLADLLGQLVQLLRMSPEQGEAIAPLLKAATARVAAAGEVIEAGIENSWALDGDSLKGRLQARQVDAIRIAAGAPSAELLALAQALADDSAPIPSTSAIRVKLLPDSLPLSDQRPAIPDPSIAFVPRARKGDQIAGLVEGILRELDRAIQRQQWHAALHDAQAAVRMLPGLEEDPRRTFSIALKRLLSRPVLEALIEQGYRAPEEQSRTAEVLRAGGFPAAELMLDILKRSDTIGPRAFLLDSLGGMREAVQIVLPLMKSARIGEICLAAELLGRLGVAEAVPALVAQVHHPEERVRHAVIGALGHYRDRAVVEPLRQALTHEAPETRVRAGRALGARSSGGMAMPLFAAFEAEKDPQVWQELLEVLARLDSGEAAMALARVALERRGFLSFGSSDMKRQLSVVRALAGAQTSAAKQALARIAAEGNGEVKRAASEALGPNA
ncbi:MAG: HEAT repeat domain-containing protein [Gemmatimonadota bacterium]